MNSIEYEKIRFLCRRGIKELDLIFQSYIEKYLYQADSDELNCLVDLLQMDDQSLLDAILNTPQDASGEQQELCKKLRKR